MRSDKHFFAQILAGVVGDAVRSESQFPGNCSRSYRAVNSEKQFVVEILAGVVTQRALIWGTVFRSNYTRSCHVLSSERQFFVEIVPGVVTQ